MPPREKFFLSRGKIFGLFLAHEPLSLGDPPPPPPGLKQGTGGCLFCMKACTVGTCRASSARAPSHA